MGTVTGQEEEREEDGTKGPAAQEERGDITDVVRDRSKDKR